MSADIFKNLRGIIGYLFQLGKDGPNLKNNSGVIEFKSADDLSFVKVRAAAPEGDHDVVTMKYFTTTKGNVIIADQADCSSAIPNNTAVRRYLVVTTAGSGAAIGDLLFDDGSSTGVMEIISAVEGRTIAITDALTGGTVTFDPDSTYCWDLDNSRWVKIGDIGSVSGAIRAIRFVIDNTATQDSDTLIPAGARVFECCLEITTAYSGGAVIVVGSTGDTDLLMESTKNVPQASGKRWSVEQDTAWVSEGVVRVSITGTPAAGAGVVIVKYSVPNA